MISPRLLQANAESAVIYQKTVLIAGILFLALFGCVRPKEGSENQLVRHVVARNAPNVKIPSQLWSQIESIGAGVHTIAEASAAPGQPPSHAQTTELDAPQEVGASAAPHIEVSAIGENNEKSVNKNPIEFRSVKLYLFEKSKRALDGRDHLVEFGPGGGELDLRDFPLSSEAGAFRVKFEFEVRDQKESPVRVFFVSNGIKRKIAADPTGLVWGGGCKRYFDITETYNRLFSKAGFLVHTSGNRHISAIAGTYVFATHTALATQLAQITIKDSRFRDLHCRD
jgi:hypothetical protein